MRQAPPSVRLLAPLLALQLLAACQGAAPGDAPQEEVGEAALALTAPVAGPELRLPRGAPAPSGPQAGPLLAHGPSGYLALFRSDLLLSAVRIGDDGRLRDGVARAVLWEELDTPALTAGALAATAAMLAAGLFEYNFGDSEFLMLFLVLVTAPFAASRDGGLP